MAVSETTTYDNQANHLYRKIDAARIAVYAQLREANPAAAEFVKEPWPGDIYRFTNGNSTLLEIYRYGSRRVVSYLGKELLSIDEDQLAAEIAQAAIQEASHLRVN